MVAQRYNCVACAVKLRITIQNVLEQNKMQSSENLYALPLSTMKNSRFKENPRSNTAI